MKLFYSTVLLFTTLIYLFGAAAPAFAEPSWTISCRNYPYSQILSLAIQQRVLRSIDTSLFTKTSASVRLQLIRSSGTNVPVEVTVDSAMNGIQLVPDPHATGLAFSVQGSADLRGIGQCVYDYIVSITSRGTDIATNIPFTTRTVSTLRVFGSVDGGVRKRLQSNTTP